MFSEFRVTFPDEEWNRAVSRIIGDQVKKLLRYKGSCSLMLTGGRTAEGVYRYWNNETWTKHSRITYLFGDERCVDPSHEASNFSMAQKTFLKKYD